jgi:hypothetical protein
MQQIAFATGHFLESTFTILSAMGWLPVWAISVVMGFGLIYWLNMQARYNRKAAKEGTFI